MYSRCKNELSETRLGFYTHNALYDTYGELIFIYLYFQKKQEKVFKNK